MNNYHDWTDEDLNTRICLLRGINMYEPQPIRDLSAAFSLARNNPPDVFLETVTSRQDYRAEFFTPDKSLSMAVSKTSLARAICEAWLLWKDAQRASDGKAG